MALSKTLNITATGNWTATTSDSWFSVSPTTGTSAVKTATVTVTENHTSSNRTGTITFTAKDNATSVTVYQNQGDGATS